MELIFNELSLTNLAIDKSEARQRMKYLLETCKEASKFGFNRLRINQSFFEQELAPSYSLNDWIVDQDVANVYKTLLIGIKRYPYIDENAILQNNVENYLQSKFFIN